MKLPELWEDFSKGKWISRKAWRRDYAISVCNLKADPVHPVLMHDTYGYLFNFAGAQTGKILKRSNKNIIHHGLQHDLFADDWFLADQTQCDLRLAEAER